MRSLNHRTGAKPYRREKKRECLVERRARRESLSASRKDIPGMYLMFKCPWRGKYYYMKGARGKCKIGAERSAHGIRWNYYLRRGKRIPRIAPPIFSRSLLFTTGILRSMKVEKETSFSRSEVKTRKILNRIDRKKDKLAEPGKSPLPSTMPRIPEAQAPHEGRCSERLAKVVPIVVHPKHLSHGTASPQPAQGSPVTRTYRLKPTMMWRPAPIKADTPKSPSKPAKASAPVKTTPTSENQKTALRELRRMRAAKAKTTKAEGKKKPNEVKLERNSIKAGLMPTPKQAVHTTSVTVQDEVRIPRHIGYISSPEKKKAPSLKVAQTDPKPPR
jgi:hypothetical protein